MRKWFYSILGILLVSYVGCYYATVRPVETAVEGDGVGRKITASVGDKKVVMEEVQFVIEKEPKYEFEHVFGEKFLEAFFRPIHNLDRRIRTKYWGEGS